MSIKFLKKSSTQQPSKAILCAHFHRTLLSTEQNISHKSANSSKAQRNYHKIVFIQTQKMANPGKLHKLIDEWNAILDYKIDEANLRKPNFGFLYGTLESLLRHLNYDINAMKDSVAVADKERLYYIKFVAYVNRLYQLSDPSSRFYYMDLLEPCKYFCHTKFGQLPHFFAISIMFLYL